jgi:hypothetical protein
MRTWDEEGGRHWKRGGGSKPFRIEARIRDEAPEWVRLWRKRGWWVWGRYRTERDRAEAMKAATTKYWYRHYEFRATQHAPEESKR